MRVNTVLNGGIVSKMVLAATATLALSSGALAADFTMKFAAGTQNEPMHAFMKLYEPCLETATDGRIDVQLFPGGQLGGMSSMIEGIQFGTLEVMFGAAQHMKGVEKRYGVVDAPGLFNSFEHANAAYWDPIFREPFLNLGRDKGVMGIAIFAYGPTSYQTREAVTKLADFKGLKVRILASDVERKLTDALGAAGLQVDWPEIVPALQRGQIDGVHSNIVIAEAQKFYTVAEHATLTNESMIPVVPFLSVKFFDKLPPDLQEAVLACGRSVEQEAAKVAIEMDQTAQEKWEAAGGQIHLLSPEEQAELNKKAAAVADEVYADDPDVRDIYNALKEAAKKHAS